MTKGIDSSLFLMNQTTSSNIQEEIITQVSNIAGPEETNLLHSLFNKIWEKCAALNITSSISMNIYDILLDQLWDMTTLI